MNSRNSFFSTGLFKDAFLRIWPACLAYVIICLMVLLPMTLGNDYSSQDHSKLLVTIGAGPAGMLTIVLFSFIIVARAFSHLFVKNGAEFYGSLPISRTATFASEYLAAFISMIACNVFIALVLLLVSGPGRLSIVAIVTVLGACCIYSFVFSALSVLCVMLSGRRGISFLLYLMLNGYVFITSWGLSQALNMTVFGWTYETLPDVTWASPAAYLGISILPYLYSLDTDLAVISTDAWILLGKYALVAAVAIVISLLLHKHRKLEMAGDALAFSVTRPVVTVAFALAAGLGFALFVQTLMNYRDVNGVLLFSLFVVASLVAYVVIESIMARGVGVMKKRVKGTAVVACSSIAIAIACLVGVQGAMCAAPAADDVDAALLPGYSVQFDSKEDIQKVIDLQQLIVDTHAMGGIPNEYTNIITFVYKMKDGSEVKRSFEVGHDSNGNLMPKIKTQLDSIVSGEGAAQWYAQCLDEWASKFGNAQNLTVEFSDKNGVYRSIEIPTADKSAFVGMLKQDIAEHGARPNSVSADIANNADEYDASVIFEMGSGYDPTNMGSLLSGYTLSESKTPETVKWLKSHYNIELFRPSQITYAG